MEKLLTKRASLNTIRSFLNVEKTAFRIRSFAEYFSVCGLNLEKLYLLYRVRKHSQLGNRRLGHLYGLAKEIEKKKIRGAFVECGVWKGGASAVMAAVSQKAKSHRKIWLFDSFEGMPRPQEIDGERVRIWLEWAKTERLEGLNVAKIEETEKLFFEDFDFDREDIVIKKGWLEHTLPVSKLEIGDIAILHIDVDFYNSTKDCLDYLYDNVVQGGYIILDDYNWFAGCRIAVDTFVRERNLKIKLLEIDAEGVYFKKP